MTKVKLLSPVQEWMYDVFKHNDKIQDKLKALNKTVVVNHQLIRSQMYVTVLVKQNGDRLYTFLVGENHSKKDLQEKIKEILEIK